MSRHDHFDPSNYDKPDTSRGDFYCSLCDSRMNNRDMWASHIIGKRHLNNVKKPPGEMPSKIKYVVIDEPPLILDDLDEVTEPIVGLDFLCEIRKAGSTSAVMYSCFLCQGNYTKDPMIEHLFTMKHRMNYLKKSFPADHDMVESLRLPKSQLEPIVRNLAVDKENEYGRGRMEVKLEKSQGQVVQDGRLYTKPYYNPRELRDKFISKQERNLDAPSTSGYCPQRKPDFPFKKSGSDSAIRHDPARKALLDFPSKKGPSDLPSKKGPLDFPSGQDTSGPSKKSDSSSFYKSEVKSTEKEKSHEPASSSPQEPFELNFKTHSKYFTAKQVFELCDSVNDTILNKEEKVKSEPMSKAELAISLRTVQLQWAAYVNSIFRKATKEEKEVMRYKFSKRGIEDRNKKIMKVFNIHPAE